MLGQTIQLALRVAIVWALGMVLAVGVSALLPESSGIPIPARQGDLFVSYSRMGFWTCMFGPVIVTGLIVFRAMMADIGLQSFH
jgi:uncharacterized membrane protein